MKQYLKNILFAAVVAVLLAAPAAAQTYSTVKTGTSGNFTHREALATSATTPAWENVPSTSANHSLILTASTGTVTVTTVFALSDGSVTASRTDIVGTGPTKISASAPLDYQKFRVSPTGIGTATLAIDSVGTK
ncbi:MAG: hypothetical protein R3D70_05920 [Rhizobiaceae bacterium]